MVGGTRLVTRSEALGWFADAGVTTPDSAEVRGWAARHEAKLEAMEAAA